MTEQACSVYPDLIACINNFKRAEDFAQALEHLGRFARADGCVIWEKFHAGNDQRRYFRLAHWFAPDCEAPPYYFLPRQTETGDAIEFGQFRIVRDVQKAADEGRLPNSQDLLSRRIRAFCSTPVTFGHLREASVNLYWRGDDVPNDAELEGVRAAAEVIPALLNSALDRIGFEVLQTVERKLNEVNPSTTGLAATFENVLRPVAEAFNALECSIFLEDRTTRPGEFTWIASAGWPWKRIDRAASYTVRSRGLTPWVIRHNQTLRFVDLAEYESEMQAYAHNEVYKTDNPEIYHDLTWPTKQKLMEEAKALYPSPLPPLGFLCVPIQDADRVVGAVRCCLTRSAPFLFDQRHIHILQLVAEQIGHWWSTRIALRAEKEETARFTRLVRGVADMHELAFRSLKADEQPQMKPLWDRSLELLAEITPWPEALSIRAVQGDHLGYVSHLGKRWGQGSNLMKKLATTYSLNDLQWGGSRAVKDFKVITESDPGLPGRIRSLMFPAATRIVHAPILAGNRKALGVIDVRGFDDREIPPHLGLICELIGRQLGLYQNLQELFWNLRSREIELSKQKEEQNQAYEDFVHQLRNPLVKAAAMAEEADSQKLPALSEIRSHLRHANMFADTINYFVELAKHDRLEAELSIMHFRDIVPLLQQMAADQDITKANNRRIRFRVDDASFEPLYRLSVMYSQQLLLHCIFNLLDNAAKYSRSDSEVQIRANYDEGGKRFLIAISNQTGPNGHRVDRADRDRLVERGERGDRARLTTAGGRGIGLWLVKKFMEAMKGDLIVIPTDSRDRNVFILSFRTCLPQGETKS